MAPGTAAALALALLLLPARVVSRRNELDLDGEHEAQHGTKLGTAGRARHLHRAGRAGRSRAGAGRADSSANSTTGPYGGWKRCCCNREAIAQGCERCKGCSKCTTFGQDPAKDCKKCLSGYDPYGDCTECQEDYDEQYDCQVCTRGNDLEDNCESLDDDFRNEDECIHGRDLERNCKECLPNYADEECTECEPGYDLMKDCKQCLPNFEDLECTTCKRGWDTSTWCQTCEQNYDPSSGCLRCVQGWDIETDCRRCLPGFKKVDLQCVKDCAGEEGTCWGVYVIGDTHGDHNYLVKALLSTGKFEVHGSRREHEVRWKDTESNDFEVVVLGDMVDRGERSLSNLALLFELARADPLGRLKIVLGNHESLMLRADLRYASDRGDWTPETILKAHRQEHRTFGVLEWLRALPVLHMTHGLIMAHAGLSRSAMAAVLQRIEERGRGTDCPTNEELGIERLAFAEPQAVIDEHWHEPLDAEVQGELREDYTKMDELKAKLRALFHEKRLSSDAYKKIHFDPGMCGTEVLTEINQLAKRWYQDIRTCIEKSWWEFIDDPDHVDDPDKHAHKWIPKECTARKLQGVNDKFGVLWYRGYGKDAKRKDTEAEICFEAYEVGKVLGRNNAVVVAHTTHEKIQYHCGGGKSELPIFVTDTHWKDCVKTRECDYSMKSQLDKLGPDADMIPQSLVIKLDAASEPFSYRRCVWAKNARACFDVEKS